LTEEDLKKIIVRAEKEENKKLPINEEAITTLCNLSGTDGRYLLNMCEELFNSNLKKKLNSEELLKFLQQK
jgi:putative ATPase